MWSMVFLCYSAILENFTGSKFFAKQKINDMHCIPPSFQFVDFPVICYLLYIRFYYVTNINAIFITYRCNNCIIDISKMSGCSVIGTVLKNSYVSICMLVCLGNSIVSVSYTHLDVYKRQALE